MQDFYVYAYVREDRTPYYIGKGTGKRIYDPCRRTPKPSEKDRIIKVVAGLSEQESFGLEKSLIAFYGRKDLGTGILRNLTDGGEGSSGAILSAETRHKMGTSRSGKLNHQFQKPHSPETRAKIAATLTGRTGRKLTEEQKANLRGRVVSVETRSRLSEAGKQRYANRPPKITIPKEPRVVVFSEKHRANLSASMKGKAKSEEHKAKLRAAALLQHSHQAPHWLGKPRSEETKAKIRATLLSRRAA
jgi:hypothetical protein